MDELWSWVAVVHQWINDNWEWEPIRDFGNSTFFTSLVGALAGAWAGGRVAQILASKAKDRDELTKDIRNANAAATMASALCDDFAGFMRQHVKPMKETFDTDRAAAAALMTAPQRQPGTSPAHFTTDLKQLYGPSLRTDTLQQLLFGHVTNERALKLIIVLTQSATNVQETNAQRNKLVEQFRTSGINQNTLMLFHYFGFPSPAGQTDDRYNSLLSGLHGALHDGIYFSRHLAQMLVEHADALAKQYKKRFGKPVPVALELDFSRLDEWGLMPDKAKYADFDALLNPPRKPSRWQRI